MHEESELSWSEFEKVEIRIGTVISAEYFREAKKPAIKMVLDFGSFGKRKTSAQISTLYKPEGIIGMQVLAVVNFPPKQIANIMSECLVLGAVGENSEVTLIKPERLVPNGIRVK